MIKEETNVMINVEIIFEIDLENTMLCKLGYIVWILKDL